MTTLNKLSRGVVSLLDTVHLINVPRPWMATTLKKVCCVYFWLSERVNLSLWR